MSFLDKPLSEMSLADIQRLISVEVSAQIPPIPAGLRDLSNLDQPLILPDVNVNGQVLTYNSATNTYQPKTITSATGVTDAGTPSTPVVAPLIAGPGWIQAKWAASSGTADPLAYKVFIRAGSAPTTADTTYLVGTTTALSLVINTLADGTTQIGPPSTVYHVKVIAVSALSGGGTSAASTDVTGSPAAIDGVTTTFTNIQAGTITAGDIAAARFETNFLTAAQATITTLSSIVANIGTITSGTITGTLIQTAAVNNARLVLDSTSLRSLAADNSTIWSINAATGAFATGSGSLVTTLSTIAADFGTITAGTVTGATIRTAASGKRIFMDSTGLSVYGDDGSTVVISIPTAASTDATFSGSMNLTSDVVQPLNAATLVVVAGGSLTGSTQYFISFSWYDGTHETQPSPINNATTTNTNKTINVTVPAAPRAGLQARVYMNTASFGAGGGKLQSSTAVSTSASTTIAVASFNSGGAASVASNSMNYATGTLQPATKDQGGNNYGFIVAGDGRVRFLGPTINTQWWWYDDFLGGNITGPLTTTLVNSGTVTAGVSLQANPGLLAISTNNVSATGGADVGFASNSVVPGLARIRCSFYFQVVTVQDSTNTYNIQLGLSDTTSATAIGTAGNHAIAFSFQSTGATAPNALGLRTNDGANSSFANAVDITGATYTLNAGTYVFVEFEINSAGTSVDWWVNSVKQTAKTSNLPAAGTAMAMHATITKAATAASRVLRLDAMAIYGDFAS